MNILVLDVRNICTMTDYFIIAEGTVDRHVKAISQFIIEQMGKHGQKPFHCEGLLDSDWVVLDYSDIVIHLFTPEMREKYGLEHLWKDGRVVDVKISTPPNLLNSSKGWKEGTKHPYHPYDEIGN